MAIDPLGTGGERHLGRPQRGLAAEQIERGGAQQTQHGACCMGLQHVTILAKAVVFDVEEAVFDAPMPAAQGQQLLRASLVGGKARDQIARLRADLSGGHTHHLRGDFRHLAQSWQRAVAREGRGGAHRAALNPAVPLAHPNHGGEPGISGEEEGGVGIERALVFLSRNT